MKNPDTDASQMRDAANSIWELAKTYSSHTRNRLKDLSSSLHLEAKLLEEEELRGRSSHGGSTD